MEQQIAELPLNDRLLTWFEVNKKNVVVGTVIVVGAAFVYFFYLDARHKKQVDAGESLSRALMEEYQTGGNMATADGMLKVAAEKAGTTAGGQAVLLAAGAYFRQGRYAEAQAQFERFLREYPGNQFGAQAQLGVASSLHAQGKLDEAVAAYKNADRQGSVTELQAKFGQASIFSAQGKSDQALSLYENIFQGMREAGNSPLFGEAANRAMELRSKLPAPAAPVAAPSAAPMKLLTSTNSPAAK